MKEIKTKIKISQHTLNQVEKIIENIGEITQFKTHMKMVINDDQQEIEVEAHQSSLYLFRKTAESQLEAQFDLQHPTKLVLSYLSSELTFEVLTTQLVISKEQIDLSYTLFNLNSKVGDYKIIFEMKV